MESTESIKELIEKGKGKDELPATSAYLPSKVDYTDDIIEMEEDLTHSFSTTDNNNTPLAIEKLESEYINSLKIEEANEFIEDSTSVTFNPFIGISRLPLGSVKFDKHNKESFLGKGAFGQVYKGEWNKRLVALKRLILKRHRRA